MKVIGRVSRAKWDEIVRGCGWATFFHTYEWARVIEETFDQLRVATKLFVFPEGTEVVLPLVSSRRGLGGFFALYQSMVPGVYGNLVSNRELPGDKVDQIFKSLLKIRLAYLKIIGNPFAGYAMPGDLARKPMFTQILRLEEGFQAIWKNFSKGHKSSAKKAQKMGVTIDVAGSMEDYRGYFAIYQDSIKRWGERASSSYPFSLFENIYGLHSPGVTLWLAKLGDKTISGALVFYCNKHAVWWHGATLGEYFSYCPANLLQAEIIKDACNRGCEVYDFNPSGGHEGVVKFKKSFGARTVDFSFYELGDSAVYKAYRKLRGG